MREAKTVKRDIELADVPVDPSFISSVTNGGAFIDHRCKVTIDGDRERLAPDGSGKPSRNVEFVACALTPGKRNQRPHFGIVEFDLVTVGAVGHGENAKRIGFDQRFRRECETVRHPVSRDASAGGTSRPCSGNALQASGYCSCHRSLPAHRQDAREDPALSGSARR